jgi:hypothetical protein
MPTFFFEYFPDQTYFLFGRTVSGSWAAGFGERWCRILAGYHICNGADIIVMEDFVIYEVN